MSKIYAQCRLIISAPGTAYWNMAVDETLLLENHSLDSLPVLRFYTWSGPAVSIGYFQSVHRALDQKQCEKENLTVVRRITGGRTVYHDSEITYSLVSSQKDSLFSGSLLQSYLLIGKCLLKGLKNLGVSASLVPRRRKKKLRTGSELCFQVPSVYEIEVEGKKIIGSAQYRKKNSMLQQGSIPVRFDYEKIARIIGGCDADELKKTVGCLEEFAGRELNRETIIRSLTRGFEEVLGVKFLHSSLTGPEIRTAEELIRTRYSRKEWNFKRP